MVSNATLKESEEKFRNVFENSSTGKSFTAIDGSVNVNPAFCEMLGYTKEELAHQKRNSILAPLQSVDKLAHHVRFKKKKRRSVERIRTHGAIGFGHIREQADSVGRRGVFGKKQMQTFKHV
jgi:PAS domain S-box-containing protein